MKTRLGKMLACLFAGIVTATAADYTVFSASTSNPPLFYYICPNSKITKEDAPDYSEMSWMNSLRFKAAANERESAQMILTGAGSYTNFKMQLDGDLEMDGDLETSAGITIPKSNFEIYYEHYVDEVADCEITDSGRYPDALIPSAMATDTRIPVSKRPTNFTINSTKKNQGFWFTINVPNGQEPGFYRANLQFSYTLNGSASTYEIPVFLTVFDFELPDKTENVEWLEVHATSYDNNIPKITASTGITGDDANLVYLGKMNEFLDQRKITSGHSGVRYNWVDADKNSVSAYIDGIYEFVLKNKAPYYDITVDNTTTEAPIKLEDNTDFFKVLHAGRQTFRSTGYIIPSKAKKLEDITDTLLLSHISKISSELASNLQEQAHKYLDISSESVDSPENPLYEENKNLENTMTHFYAKYLIEYGAKASIQNDQGYYGNVRAILRDVTLNWGPNHVTSPYYRYLYSPLSVISASDNEKFAGVNTLLKGIVDKSVEKDLDLLQYAFLKIPCIDEPAAWSLDANLETLVNARVFENCKKTIKEYIDKKTASTTMKTSLQKSLNNLMFLFTTAPTTKDMSYVYAHNKTETVYTAIQHQGLNRIYKMPNCSQLMKLLKLEYDPIAKCNVYRTKYAKQDAEIKIEDTFRNKYYCTLFTDYSKNKLASAQDFDSTWSVLGHTPMWWYSCTSNRSASLAGFRLNQNRGIYNDNNGIIYMNPLAVKRANKWQQYEMGIIGEHFWAVDDAFKNENENRNVSQWGIKGNENVLVYPVKQLLKNVYGITNEKTLNNLAIKYGYFCSTIRMENEGEAADDYDYLCLAEDLVEQHPEYRDELNRIISSVINPGNVDYTDTNKTNAANLTKARLDLAALIEKLTENIHKDSDGFSIPAVSNWKTSYKGISFDFKPTTSINSASKIVASIYLYQNNLCLTQAKKLRLDGSTANIVGTITKLENGWYNYTVPFSAFPENQSGYGSKTVNRVQFGSMAHRFLIKDIKIVKEVSNTTANNSNTFTAAADNVPVVQNWRSSGKTLCFDVYETSTYKNSNGKRQATVSLMNSDWKLLNNLFQIDFANKKLINCPGSVIDKGNGWLTVQIPLNTVPLYNGSSSPAATGKETLSMVHFKKDNVFRSFLVDNFRLI